MWLALKIHSQLSAQSLHVLPPTVKKMLCMRIIGESKLASFLFFLVSRGLDAIFAQIVLAVES